MYTFGNVEKAAKEGLQFTFLTAGSVFPLKANFKYFFKLITGYGGFKCLYSNQYLGMYISW